MLHFCNTRLESGILYWVSLRMHLIRHFQRRLKIRLRCPSPDPERTMEDVGCKVEDVRKVFLVYLVHLVSFVNQRNKRYLID
jgi:hypothetical protein